MKRQSKTNREKLIHSPVRQETRSIKYDVGKLTVAVFSRRWNFAFFAVFGTTFELHYVERKDVLRLRVPGFKSPLLPE